MTDLYNRALNSHERYVTISGKLQDIQKSIQEIVVNIEDFSMENKIPSTLKLLIEQQFVSKIIGVGIIKFIIGGNMIKEISNISGGAQVKIKSNKEKEREMNETVTNISGKMEAKIKAANIIIEKIMTFKYTLKVSNS